MGFLGRRRVGEREPIRLHHLRLFLNALRQDGARHLSPLAAPLLSASIPAGDMKAFDQLAAMPGLRSLFDTAWRLFGVNPALVSPDGQRVVLFDKQDREQPFCSALQEYAAGRALCTMCDQNRFLEARRSPVMVQYRCHAGLREFLVPVIRNGETIALLQCGQVHDRQPTGQEWRAARQDLSDAGIKSGPLQKLFRENRVLSPDRQRDLLNLLELVASRLAHADEHHLGADPGQTHMQIGRAVTFIEVHLNERLALPVIARAAGVSTRSLVRLFRKEVGTTVLDFILRRRVARARHLLRRGGQTCCEIAFAAGFGSVQHFNRIFRRFEDTSPRQWMRRSAALATPQEPSGRPRSDSEREARPAT